MIKNITMGLGDCFERLNYINQFMLSFWLRFRTYVIKFDVLEVNTCICCIGKYRAGDLRGGEGITHASEDFPVTL